VPPEWLKLVENVYNEYLQEVAMKVDIIPIRMMFDTVYVVRGDGVILIDGGDPHKQANLKRGLDRASISPEEIKLILLTHGHWDHIGSAKDIQALTGARVFLH